MLLFPPFPVTNAISTVLLLMLYGRKQAANSVCVKPLLKYELFPLDKKKVRSAKLLVARLMDVYCIFRLQRQLQYEMFKLFNIGVFHSIVTCCSFKDPDLSISNTVFCIQPRNQCVKLLSS